MIQSLAKKQNKYLNLQEGQIVRLTNQPHEQKQLALANPFRINNYSNSVSLYMVLILNRSFYTMTIEVYLVMKYYTNNKVSNVQFFNQLCKLIFPESHVFLTVNSNVLHSLECLGNLHHRSFVQALMRDQRMNNPFNCKLLLIGHELDLVLTSRNLPW